jgi:hypothetical protein
MSRDEVIDKVARTPPWVEPLAREVNSPAFTFVPTQRLVVARDHHEVGRGPLRLPKHFRFLLLML